MIRDELAEGGGRLDTMVRPSRAATAYVPATPTASDVPTRIFSSSSSSASIMEFMVKTDGRLCKWRPAEADAEADPDGDASSLPSPPGGGCGKGYCSSLYFFWTSCVANSVASISDSNTTFFGNGSLFLMGGCG